MVSQQAFFFANGAYAETVTDLRRVLPEVDDSFVYRHLTDEKNDFALWVQEVFHEQKLADRLRECHTKEDLIDALDAYLLDDGYGNPPVHVVTDEYVAAKQYPERTPKDKPQATVFHAPKPEPPKPTHYENYVPPKHEEHHEHHDTPPEFPHLPRGESAHKEKLDPSLVVEHIASKQRRANKLTHAHKEFLFGIVIGILVAVAVFALIRAFS